MQIRTETAVLCDQRILTHQESVEPILVGDRLVEILDRLTTEATHRLRITEGGPVTVSVSHTVYQQATGERVLSVTAVYLRIDAW